MDWSILQNCDGVLEVWLTSISCQHNTYPQSSTGYHKKQREPPPHHTSTVRQPHLDKNNVVWPRECWSVYYQSVRTNNDLEGWHNRLNSSCRAGMNMYMLAKLLHVESSKIPVQVRQENYKGSTNGFFSKLTSYRITGKTPVSIHSFMTRIPANLTQSHVQVSIQNS